MGSTTVSKASGGERSPAELFQILKDNAVKVLHSICQQIWKTQQWLLDWERSVFIPIPKKGNAKECSNYHTVSLISHASKVTRKKINEEKHPQTREKAEEQEIKLPTSFGAQKKQENSRKTSTSASLTMPKLFTVWITTNCGKFLKR